MNRSVYGKYQKLQVQTADKGALLLMLYDGIIVSLKKSQQFLKIEPLDRKELSEQTFKAREIIYELMSALDLERGGEVAENLMNLYQYFLVQIGKASTEKDPSHLDDVLTHVQDLRSAWASAVQTNRTEQQKKQRSGNAYAQRGPASIGSQPQQQQHSQKKRTSKGGFSA